MTRNRPVSVLETFGTTLAIGPNGPVMGGEAPHVRLSGMNAPVSTRRRLTDAAREASRLSAALADHLGQVVKSARVGLRLTQDELGRHVGVGQGWISRIELGHGERAPIALWVALGVALHRPLAITFSRPLGRGAEAADAGHLEIQERLLELARTTGRTGTFELPTRPLDPRYSVDSCVKDPRHRVLIIEEAWNTFGDLGAAVRSTTRKTAEAAELAAVIDDGPPYRVATVWVVRPTAANRALIGRYPQIVRTAFPGSSRSWARALIDGTAPPAAPGLVWLDPSTGRVIEWRLRPS